MYGWRARLGVLVPSGNVAIEPEFGLMTPEGVACHYHRFAFVGGKTNEEIAEELAVDVETIKHHVKHILAKLGVEDRTQAAVWAVRHGLV